MLCFLAEFSSSKTEFGQPLTDQDRFDSPQTNDAAPVQKSRWQELREQSRMTHSGRREKSYDWSRKNRGSTNTTGDERTQV